MVLDGVGPAEVLEFFHHLFHGSAAFDDKLAEFQGLGTQRMDAEHVHAQQHILNGIGHIINMLGQGQDILSALWER